MLPLDFIGGLSKRWLTNLVKLVIGSTACNINNKSTAEQAKRVHAPDESLLNYTKCLNFV